MTVAYIKGILADGHVYERKNTIRIVVRQKDDEWLKNHISPMITETFNTEPRIIKTSDGVWMLWSYIKKTDVQSDMLETLLKPLNKINFEKDEDKLAFVKGIF